MPDYFLTQELIAEHTPAFTPRLFDCSVLVVGLGGNGCHVALAAVRMGFARVVSTDVARAFEIRTTGLAADLHSLLPEYEAALRECRGINCEPSKSRLTTPLLACS